MKKKIQKMKCVNAKLCTDSCGHKEEHDLNGGCLQSCFHMMGEKTCVTVEDLRDESRNKQSKRRRVTNPRMPKRKVQSKDRKTNKTSKRISK